MGLFESIRTLTWCQLLACSLFTLLAGWHFFQGDYLPALMYFSGSLITALMFFTEQNSTNKNFKILSRVFFSAYTLISLLLLLLTNQQNSLLHLSAQLAYPLLAFSLLSFRTALFYVLIFSVIANLLLMLQLEGTFRAAYLVTFWLVILLSSLHSFAHYIRQEKLQKQLNRDQNTQFLNKRQLLVDLHKEQERAQRETTYLGVVYLENDQDFDKRTAAETAKHFAAYESLYSVATDQLVALIPLASPKDLKVREKQLLKQLPELKISLQLSSPEKPPINYLPASTNKLEAVK